MKNKLFLLLAVASLTASVSAWNYLPEWLGGTKKEEVRPAAEVKPEVKEEAQPAEVKPAEATAGEAVTTSAPAEEAAPSVS